MGIRSKQNQIMPDAVCLSKVRHALANRPDRYGYGPVNFDGAQVFESDLMIRVVTCPKDWQGFSATIDSAGRVTIHPRVR